MRRAWIEIIPVKRRLTATTSLSVRRAWIEITWNSARTLSTPQSLSVRRAWIEIIAYTSAVALILVALREESVD